MSASRFEPGSFVTERERSTNWAINHWQDLVATYQAFHNNGGLESSGNPEHKVIDINRY
jgi:hypothetical protein